MRPCLSLFSYYNEIDISLVEFPRKSTAKNYIDNNRVSRYLITHSTVLLALYVTVLYWIDNIPYDLMVSKETRKNIAGLFCTSSIIT